MKSYRFLKGIKVLVMVILALAVFGYVTMHLWNWLMPSLLGLHTVTFWQALGLLLLSKILFGGFHRHGGGDRRRFVKQQWAQMSAEDREKFRSGMRGRGGWCRPARQGEPVESTSI